MNRGLPYLVSFFALLSIQSFSQVGINTLTPEPSSALDIFSTTQGFLAPRMSTAQRLDIVNQVAPDPVAEGLLVFDIDLDAFYFYDSTISDWRKLVTDKNERDNYVLVKSEADFPTPSGGVITLDSNTLYEINGSITLTNTIDINNAYLAGRDLFEDQLIRTSGAIFTGATGGVVKNLYLSSTGGSVFSLSNPDSSQVLVIEFCSIVSNASVGSISGYAITYLNKLQFDSNSDGITFSGQGGTLLLNYLTWFGSNSGTFETYSGNYSLIEKTAGFFDIPSGSTGLDVSSNPTVTTGVIEGATFSGAGTFVNGYTVGSYVGYQFSDEWYVNSPGLKVESDNTASADFYYNGSLTTGFTQAITSGTAVEIRPGGATFASNNLFRFSALDGNTLEYIGSKERQFHITATLSIRVDGGAGNFYAFVIAKNGNIITESNALVFIDSNSQIQNIAVSTIASLENGDDIEVYVQRLTGPNATLVVFSENLSIN